MSECKHRKDEHGWYKCYRQPRDVRSCAGTCQFTEPHDSDNNEEFEAEMLMHRELHTGVVSKFMSGKEPETDCKDCKHENVVQCSTIKDYAEGNERYTCPDCGEILIITPEMIDVSICAHDWQVASIAILSRTGNKRNATFVCAKCWKYKDVYLEEEKV